MVYIYFFVCVYAHTHVVLHVSVGVYSPFLYDSADNDEIIMKKLLFSLLWYTLVLNHVAKW